MCVCRVCAQRNKSIDTIWRLFFFSPKIKNKINKQYLKLKFVGDAGVGGVEINFIMSGRQAGRQLETYGVPLMQFICSLTTKNLGWNIPHGGGRGKRERK